MPLQITLVSSGERLVAERKSKMGTKSLAHLQKKGVKVRRLRNSFVNFIAEAKLSTWTGSGVESVNNSTSMF